MTRLGEAVTDDVLHQTLHIFSLNIFKYNCLQISSAHKFVSQRKNDINGHYIEIYALLQSETNKCHVVIIILILQDHFQDNNKNNYHHRKFYYEYYSYFIVITSINSICYYSSVTMFHIKHPVFTKISYKIHGSGRLGRGCI